MSRLLGAPPGYVGSEEEGRLTAAVRNTPFSILLFDEIEKAHQQIFDIFLPILEEGRLKDSRGKGSEFPELHHHLHVERGRRVLEQVRDGPESAGDVGRPPQALPARVH